MIMVQPFPKQALIFKCLQYKSCENTVGKGESAHNEQFLFSSSVFYSSGELSAIFIKFKTVVFMTLSVWKSIKFVIWERV